MTAQEIAAALNQELRVSTFSDVSNNGLQIDNRGPIRHLITAVDASLETLQKAVDSGAQMLVVHHGISWGNSLARIDGLNYKLISFAIEHNLALYAAHLPLDAHPELGNNAGLAKAIGLEACRPFLHYHGQTIGIAGRLPEPLSRQAFAERVQVAVQPQRMECFDFGKEMIETVGICSGGAPEGVDEAAQEGLDCYLCGEANLVAYNLAKGWGINAVFAGHYATERFGVRALGQWIQAQFGISARFLDFDLPY
jgi:dinuclear metal center YbgI/SA1388 family protein